MAESDALIQSIGFGGAGAGTFAFGGSVSLNAIANTADAHIAGGTAASGGRSDVDAAGAILVSASDTSKIQSIAAGLAGSKDVAAGAALATNDLSGATTAYIAGSDVDSSGGAISVTASTNATIETLSAGAAGSGHLALSGAVSVNKIQTTLAAYLSDGAKVTASNNVNVSALDTSTIKSLAGQISIGVIPFQSVAIGASAAYNEIGNSVLAYVNNATATSTQDSVAILARSNGTIQTISAGGSFSGLAAVAGSVAINLMDNRVEARVTHGSSVAAQDNVTVIADVNNSIRTWGGTISGGLAVGIAGTVVVNTIGNETRALVDHSTIAASGIGPGAEIRTWDKDSGAELIESVRGLSVVADVNENVEVAAATAGLGAGGIAGNVAITNVADKTDAYLSASTVNSATDFGQSVTVRAHQETVIDNKGGALAAGGLAAAAGVDTVLLENVTRAFIADADGRGDPGASGLPARRSLVYARGVEVSTATHERIRPVVAGAALAGQFSLAGSISTIQINNDNAAYIRQSDVNSLGNLSVLADDIASITTFAGAISGSLSASAGGSVAVNSITSSTRASVVGADLNARGATQVIADSDETITTIVATGAVGATAGLAGAVSVNSIETTTEAEVVSGSRPSRINQDADYRPGGLHSPSTAQTMRVWADNNASITATGGGLGAGLIAGIGASIDVGTIKNRTVAKVGVETDIFARGNVDVLADSTRNLDSTTAAFGGGLLGLSGAISVLSLGGPLDGGGASEFTTGLRSQVNGDIALDSLQVNAKDGSTATRAKDQVDGLSDPSVNDTLSGSRGDAVTRAYVEMASTIEGGAELVSLGNITIQSSNSYDVDVNAGQISAGVAGIGAGIASVSIRNQTDAFLGDFAVLDAAGNVTIKASDRQSGAQSLAKAFAGNFGILGMGGATAGLKLDLNTDARVGDQAAIRQAADVNITTDQQSNVKTVASGLSGGAVADGKTSATTTVTIVNTAAVGDHASIVASNFTLRPESNHTVDAESTGSGGGAVALSNAGSVTSVHGQTSARLGDSSRVTAANTIFVEPRTSIGADAFAGSDTGGLGTDSTTNSRTTVTATTTTLVGSGAEIAALDTTIRSRAVKLDTEADSSSVTAAIGADTDATSVLATTSTVTVTIMPSASIRGDNRTVIAAQHDTLQTDSKALAQTTGALADSDPSASNTLTTTTRVDARAGSRISTRDLLVEANVPSAPVFSTIADKSGALIDWGEESRTFNLTLNRSIAFNSAVTLLGPMNPLLVIDDEGNITQQVNFPVVQVTGSEIIVPHIENNDNSLAGTIKFSIPTSIFDALSGFAFFNITTSRTLTGAPSVVFQTGYESVTIENQSDRDLRIQNISVINSSPQLQSNIQVAVGNASGFTVPTVTTDPGQTAITISGEGQGDITLGGVIDNPLGATTVNNQGGNILAGSVSARTRTTELGLFAPAGRIGAGGVPLRTESTLLTAAADQGVELFEMGGDLLINTVVSSQGWVALTAQGSILDGNSTTPVDISAPDIQLVAFNGSIGTTADPLEVDVSGSTLTALARNDIVVTDVAGGLGIGEVTSTTGNITITLPDDVNPGQDLTLADGAVIRALEGSVTLRIGDNLTMASGSSIRAARSLEIFADYGNADPGTGAIVDIRGELMGASISIVTGADDDVVSLTNVAAGMDMTIDTGAGADTIHVGSQATTTTNTGGLLSTIRGRLTIDAGTGNDRAHFDDSGREIAGQGTLASNELLGFGMTQGIEFLGVSQLKLSLGADDDSLSVTSTAANSVTTIDAGPGNDLLSIGSADGKLNEIAGQLVIDGGPDHDTLRVHDQGDTADNAGLLTRDQLLGLGMSGPDQTEIDAARGVQFTSFETMGIWLGSGNNLFTVAGTSAATAVRLGEGNDKVTVGTNLSLIQAPILIHGDEGDELHLNLDVPATLTLDRVNDSRAKIQGGPAPIEFTQFGSLSVDLSNEADSFTIHDTTVPVHLNAGGGADSVVVMNVSHATNIHLGMDTEADEVTLFRAEAELWIEGHGDGFDTLNMDFTTTTAAFHDARIEDGDQPDSGMVRGLTAVPVHFRDLRHVAVKLGSGNDEFVIDTSARDNLNNTIVEVSGGAGDDQITVLSLGSSSTIVSGGSGQDTVTAVIPGVPVSQQFSSLNLDVETLVVDNSENSLPVDWTRQDGALLRATPSGSGETIDVISTEGAELIRILGGTSGADTLNIDSDVASDIVGTIDGNQVNLRSGLVVLEPSGFNRLKNFEDVIGFDTLTAATTSYLEDGFRLTSTSTIEPHDAISRSAKVTAPLTLVPQDGGGFALYSVELGVLNPGTHTVTVTGTTLNGQSVTRSLDVPGETGFTRFELPGEFTGLQSVAWSVPTAGMLLVDNIVVDQTFAAVSEEVFPEDPGGVALTTTMQIDTLNLRINGTGSGGMFNGTTFHASHIENGSIAQFRFAGNLIIPHESFVSVVGDRTRGVSLVAGNNVMIGDDVIFDFDAQGTTPGPGGGGAGGAGAAGTTGGDGRAGGSGGDGRAGGAGGVSTNCGTAIVGVVLCDLDPGDGGTAGTVGTLGLNGIAGANGSPGTAGLSGINGGIGGAFGAGGRGGNGGPAGNAGPDNTLYFGGGGSGGPVHSNGGAGGGGSLLNGDNGSNGGNANPGTAGSAGRNQPADAFLISGGGAVVVAEGEVAAAAAVPVMVVAVVAEEGAVAPAAADFRVPSLSSGPR
jgi:trimeric autotransporter adhesin